MRNSTMRIDRRKHRPRPQCFRANAFAGVRSSRLGTDAGALAPASRTSSFTLLAEHRVKMVTQAAYQCGFSDMSHFLAGF
ncbi:hypothetical protein BZM27_52855 [Paraburkholderia steynii]|uniref:HTH araC/xylS-type domain-containing protein n=1 Tax=Paraburkholderia steynii TaxID=1245441 RepID=A0A4R0X7P3_9BURK|nr:hypothetical protein BZM27_52855 [Paraburkholderia steynii]